MTESYTWGDEVKNATEIEIQTRWGEGMTPDDWFKSKEDE